MFNVLLTYEAPVGPRVLTGRKNEKGATGKRIPTAVHRHAIFACMDACVHSRVCVHSQRSLAKKPWKKRFVGQYRQERLHWRHRKIHHESIPQSSASCAGVILLYELDALDPASL